MSNLRTKQRRASKARVSFVTKTVLARIAAALRRLSPRGRAARFTLVPRRRRISSAALLGAVLAVTAIGALLMPRGARPRRPLRDRIDDLLRRGRYALLKAEYRLEETAEEAAAKAEQKARVAEQIVEKEAEGTLRGMEASLEEAKAAIR
jgi:hypothetical protein